MSKATATKKKAKKTDELADVQIASGTDPFNGLVTLFRDKVGYWLENQRTGHESEYLADEAGELIKEEAIARQYFDKEISNAQFVGAIYP